MGCSEHQGRKPLLNIKGKPLMFSPERNTAPRISSKHVRNPHRNPFLGFCFDVRASTSQPLLGPMLIPFRSAILSSRCGWTGELVFGCRFQRKTKRTPTSTGQDPQNGVPISTLALLGGVTRGDRLTSCDIARVRSSTGEAVPLVKNTT